MSQQLRDQLKKYKKKNGIQTKDPKAKKRHKEETFSRRDVEELMGVNKPTYVRKRGGSLRQR